jgi:5-methyltetrahydrofolate--homocysteine methyltransferase
VGFIDWTPFFATWELRGAYPAILDDPRVGSAARDLHRDALDLLDRIVREVRSTANAAVGFWPANTVDGDDIVVWRDEARHDVLATFRTLRQQMAKPDGRPNVAMADFVAPIETGVADFVGAFAVTTGHGLDDIVAEFEAPMTITRRSSPRPSPTAWPRPSRSGSTRSSVASCGATPATRPASATRT